MASTSLSVVVLKTIHFLSSSSRIVCTCGRIRRPLGAWMSWGITRRTTSPSDTRSPVIVRPPKPSGTIRIIHSFSSAIPAPVFALTMQTFSFVCSLSFSANSWFSSSERRSLLLTTGITGVFFSWKYRNHSSSFSMSSDANTISANSVFCAASAVFSIRMAPSSPSSSNPAVSISTHGPSGAISIVL